LIRLVENRLPGTAEAFSLFGEPLFRTPLRPEATERQKALYRDALRDFEENPGDADAIIWLGRRTAYLGRYREAASIYSIGIREHPGDPRLYRHRGHRFVTLRRFDLAIDDFERASELIEGKPDEVEPDGMPNERGVPVSSLHFNIWYHLGLAYYLEGNFEDAIRAYRECMEVSEIHDKLVATSHWLYMAQRRLGLEEEASRVLETIHGMMDIIENQNYHDCLLMYKGEKTPEALFKDARSTGTLGLVTIGYGVANWYLYNGDKERAIRVLREIIATGAWAGFGYIAAEADLRHLSLRPKALRSHRGINTTT
jgi:tetratricopeptide (TPR) repeat protein